MRRSYLDTENIILEVSGRERILNAAASLFGELGYEKTSIRSISRESGMKPGSIYYFFQSKEEILLEIYASGFSLMPILCSQRCESRRPVGAIICSVRRAFGGYL